MSLWIRNHNSYYKIIHTRLYDYKIIVVFFQTIIISFSDIKCIFLFTIIQSMRESIKHIYKKMLLILTCSQMFFFFGCLYFIESDTYTTDDES